MNASADNPEGNVLIRQEESLLVMHYLTPGHAMFQDRRRRSLVGSDLRFWTEGAAAVKQRICHELRSMEAVFVDSPDSGSGMPCQRLAVQVLMPAVARRAQA